MSTSTKTPQRPTASGTATTASDAAIGAAYLAFRRLEREHQARTAADPSDPQVGFSGKRAPLTAERDEALRTLRAAADAAIDGAGGAR